MNNKKMKKVVSVSLASALTMANFVPGFAAVDKYVFEAADSTVYEYQYTDLAESYTNSLLGLGDTALYDHYMNILDNGGSYKAILDTVSGYVDYSNVSTAYIDSVLNGQSFDVDSYTETQAPAATMPNTVKDVTVVDGSIVETEKQIGQTGDLAVSGVSAINTTTIKVTFNKEVTTEAAAKANFTLSKGTIEAATITDTNEVTLSVAGLTYEDNLTLTVTNPAYSSQVSIPAIDELYTLEITTDAENDTIKSDGSSMTMLTAKLIENATGNAVVEDAQIQFTTTLGSLSQPQVALIGGEASTQLRSTSSATSLTAVVNATVASAPGAQQYVGLTGQKIVNFTPDGTSGGTVDMVSAVSAGADQGDRFYVNFSGPIEAADYKAVVTSTAWAGDPYGIQYKGLGGAFQDIKIIDVYNVTDDTLMFVLDTDDTGSVAPTVGAGSMEMLDSAFTGAATDGNFLRDNINHTIKFPSNVTDLVVNSSELMFMSSDVTKPFIYGVDAKDASGNDSVLDITVRASESLAQTLTEGADNAPNGNFSIDGKDIKLMTGAVSAIDVLNAKNSNQLIATSLYVGEYDATTGEDSRNKVFIKLHKEFKLAPGSHGIQIANIGDLAGETDSPANTVTTQTFPFTVKADETIPTATVTAQSPEQWLVEFDRPVDSITGKDITDVLKIYTKEGYAATTKVPLVMNSGSGANDYKVSIVDENGVVETGGLDLATTATLTGVERLLVEFNQDWSVILKGNSESKDNYWKSEINPFKVVIKDVESMTGVDMVETAYDVAPQYDGISPTIVFAQDLYEKAADEAFRGITPSQNNSTGKYIYVEMSEPVQLLEENGTGIKDISNPVTPNLTQDPTQTSTSYDNVLGLPVATYRFVKDDKTVYGDAIALAEDDQSFVIQPETELESGTWTLYIEQISDDHGNTSATVNQQVVVPESAATDTDTKVSWAAFDNDGVNDYLYVKFTEEMKANVANGVDLTTNYKFRGYDLPEGSQVFQGIEGLTDGWDAVTIRMPATAWEGLNDGRTDFTTNMSVASNFESATGDRISGEMQFELTDVTGASLVEKDGLLDQDRFEAVYKNAGATLVAGTPVLFVTATDTQDDAGNPNTDGKFDTFKVQLSEANVTAITIADKYYIDGKEYNPTAAQVAGNSDEILLKPANNTDQVAGVEAITATLKTADNVVVATKVKSEAIATSAVLNADKTELTVTFNEAVTADGSGAGIFAAVTSIANTVHTDNAPVVGVATLSVKEHSASTPNVIVYNVTNGVNIGKDDTIAITAGDIETLRTGGDVETELIITDSDDIAPTMVSATIDDATHITITFSEVVTTNETNPTDFVVTDDASATFVVSAQADDTAGDNKIVLTVDDTTGYDTNLTITYTNDHDEVADQAGNVLASDGTGIVAE
ncbi:Ig-like domain-containing protein [Wukongibacter sp. M2B1]|uniref:Ig-like domain-containing protein n=1 Tax=Wukongibacter sp. M2B1 TaxID=3088895 RepID=UPI003D7B8931